MKNWLARKFLITAMVAVILAGGVGFWLHTRKDHKVAFQTATLKRGDLVSTISANGTIEPIEVIDVGAQVAGLINSFGKDHDGKTIDYGSVIDADTVLAQIDDSVYAADVSLARAQVEQDVAGEVRAAADLEQLKAKAVQTESDWKRAQELGRSKLIAGADLDNYQANFEIARANVKVGEAAVTQAKASTTQAEANLAKAQRNLAFCTIKSPVKGVIIDRRVNIGQTVVASLNAPSLFLIAKDLTRMQIWVAVNEADIGRIKVGGPVTFTCDAFPGKQFAGTVGKVRLNASMTQNVVMYTVEVNTENPDNVLLPYLTANVHFIVQKETNTLVTPSAALRWSPSSLEQIAPDARAQFPVGDSASSNSSAAKPGKDRHGFVWLKDGEFVRPVEVVIGISDKMNTAIFGENLPEGAQVITGEESSGSPTVSANPFLPQIRKR